MLKLTKKADYGLIALKHLAANTSTGIASTKEIADTYAIPLPLLAKIMQTLTRGGILKSVAGSTGGYKLARDSRKITALEVIRTIDGPIILTSCFTDHGECDQSETCTVREPLRKIHEGIVHLLDGISIFDISSDSACSTPPTPSSGALAGLVQVTQ